MDKMDDPPPLLLWLLLPLAFPLELGARGARVARFGAGASMAGGGGARDALALSSDSDELDALLPVEVLTLLPLEDDTLTRTAPPPTRRAGGVLDMALKSRFTAYCCGCCVEVAGAADGFLALEMTSFSASKEGLNSASSTRRGEGLGLGATVTCAGPEGDIWNTRRLAAPSKRPPLLLLLLLARAAMSTGSDAVSSVETLRRFCLASEKAPDPTVMTPLDCLRLRVDTLLSAWVAGDGDGKVSFLAMGPARAARPGDGRGPGTAGPSAGLAKTRFGVKRFLAEPASRWIDVRILRARAALGECS